MSEHCLRFTGDVLQIPAMYSASVSIDWILLMERDAKGGPERPQMPPIKMIYEPAASPGEKPAPLLLIRGNGTRLLPFAPLGLEELTD